MQLQDLITLALSLTATTYGHGEIKCGEPGKARPCARGAITSSGIPFDPQLKLAAVPAPKGMIIRPTIVRVKDVKGNCVSILLADKKHWRYIGTRMGGLDLSPAAVEAITHQPATRHWTGRLQACKH